MEKLAGSLTLTRRAFIGWGAAAAAGGSLLGLPASLSAAATTRVFNVPSGRQTLQFGTGGRPPVHRLRFVFGGNPDVVTERIVGATGSPDITFNPPATPFEVTLAFVQSPVAVSESADFFIHVSNESDRDQQLEVGAVFKK